MQKIITPAQVVDAARNWLNVPFAHQGRSRQGVDCLGLLVMVASDLHLRFDDQPPHALDDTHYGHRPCTKTLLRGLASCLRPIREKNDMNIGDILVLNVESRPQHLAIIGDYPKPECFSMIHAYAPSRKVIEHRLCSSWQRDIACMFRLPQLAG